MKYLFLTFFIFQAVCTPLPPKPAAEQIVAFVNGYSISEKELSDHLALKKSSYPTQASSDKKAFKIIATESLNELIQNRAIMDWGTKRGIALSVEEIAEGIASTKKGYTEKAFEAMLGEKNISFAKWRIKAEENLLVNKILKEEVFSKIEIPQKEISNYYENHIGDFKIKESVRARHIVTDSEEKAKNIMTLLVKGENFAKIAILHSLSPDRANGGDLGYFERGTHPEVFDNTCFKLKPGELSRIVKSSYGYHIFKLVGKKPARTKTLDEASAEIYALLAKDKMLKEHQKWLQTVLQESQIQIIQENLDNFKIESHL